jgi:acyl-CoA synthetase (AMP-forming)/AMP-acid ligase II
VKAGFESFGKLYLVDRLSNMILSEGFNVYPREVEQVIEGFAGVSKVAVVGIPHEMWGEQVTAVIVADGERLPETAALEAHCRREIASYKVPKKWFFELSLPLNSNGKLDQRALVALLATRTAQV